MSMALSLNDVNKKGSFTWTRCNDDARSPYFRNNFCSKFGGSFTRNGRYYEWTPSLNEVLIQPNIIEEAKQEDTGPKKTWIFKDPEGNLVKTTNVQIFCKEKNLTRSSLYDVMSGKRSSHKGYSFIETTIE